MSITMERRCPFCSTPRQLILQVTEEQMLEWKNGAVIQKAMPQLTPDEREFLLTGICNICWSALGDDE